MLEAGRETPKRESPMGLILFTPGGTTGGAGTGDVIGPAGATDEAVALYDGATGKVIKNSVVTIDGAGDITTPGLVDGRDVSVDGAKLDGIAAGATNTPLAALAPVDVDADTALVGVAGTAARQDHKHSVLVATPTELSDSTNAAGTAIALVRSDHVHAHGNRGGGPLHAVATPTAAGFMSASNNALLVYNIAEWTGTRYYAVDYDNGSDAALGYSDVSMAAAGAVAFKTLEHLRSVLPRNGRGQKVVIAIRARAGGAVYRNIADTADDALQFFGFVNYQQMLVRGTDTVATAGAVAFANDTADKIALGGRIVPGTNAAGYEPTGAPTTSVFTCQLTGGGAPGLSAEPALLGKRIRFDSATTTAALRNVCRMIHANTTDTITVENNLPATPVLTDVFYIEQPAVAVDRIQVSGWHGSTLAPASFASAGIQFAGIIMPNTTVGFLSFPARSISGTFRTCFCESLAPGTASTFSWNNISNPLINATYTDESDATIQGGTGYVCDGFGSVSGCPSLFMASSASRSGRWQILNIGGGTVNVGSGSYMGAGLLLQNCKGSGGTQNTIGGNLIGNGASATTRRLRLIGGFGTASMSLTNADAFVRGVDIQNAGALACIEVRGVGTNIVINDVVGSTGNTGVGIDLSLNRMAKILLGQLNANTVTGAAGQDIKGAGPVFYTHADYARTDLTDRFLNHFQGSTSTKIGTVSFVTNDTTAAIGQYKVVRATGAGSVVRAAQANTAANAAGVVGVSQSAFTAAPVQSAMIVTDGPTWVQFDSAPTVGAIAYLSTATAGNAQVAAPAATGTNQKLRLGRILAVSGTLGLVELTRQTLPIAANGVESDSTFGEIYVDAGVTTQVTNATPGTFDIITGFNTAQGFNGISSGTTPAKASNQITLNTAGSYRVAFTCSYTGTNNATYTCCAFLDGVKIPNACFTRKLGTGSDVGSSSFEGLFTATAGQILTARVASDGASSNFTPSLMNLNVVRIG